VFDFKRNEKTEYLIKNFTKKVFEKDFSLNPIGVFVFIIFASVGLFLFKNNNLIDYSIILIFPIIYFPLMIFFPKWEVVLKLSFLSFFLFYFWKGFDSVYSSIFFILGAVMSNVIQIAKEWERAIVLRFGKFRKVKGPGIFFLLPFIDRIDKVVDLRTRVTDFVAETTLTKDSVTVTVDALCFWLVWDAEKAICEVENYVEAVVLSSQTALRSAISKNNLSTLLENGEEIEDIVRQEVDKKTTEWGITVSHIEITDIQIPEHLQDSMSKLAQAEREKKSRILFGEAELELAKKFSEASVYYKDNEVALKLRAMNILNEGLKNGNSMIIPSNLMEEMKNIDMFGLKALDEVNKIKKE